MGADIAHGLVYEHAVHGALFDEEAGGGSEQAQPLDLNAKIRENGHLFGVDGG